ncbi:hypothetical protein TNCV_1673221 [Trichonephila clavipes]|nr:hypothetical protein TNCV_1673221 [Trichonephila clavipes]
MWNALIRTLWPIGCTLTSSSLCKALRSQIKKPIYFAHITRASRSNSPLPRSPCDHGESPQRTSGSRPVTRGIPILLREGQVEPDDGQRNQKFS